MKDSEKQANNFLEKTRTTLKVKFLKNDFYFPEDKETRNIYRITLERNGKKYSFTFGQSIFNTKQNISPDAYDILACVEKYQYINFNDFCSSFGYDEDSRKAEKIFKAVQKQGEKINEMFADCIEELREIY
jgi:hypothetical protein